jgi:hypothetical protein
MAMKARVRCPSQGMRVYLKTIGKLISNGYEEIVLGVEA